MEVGSTSMRMAQELIHARGLDGRVAARYVDGVAWPTDFVGTFEWSRVASASLLAGREACTRS